MCGSTDADEQMLSSLMQLVRQLVCDGDLMLARTMRKKVVEKCEYFRQKHETSQHVTLLSSIQLTVKYDRTHINLGPISWGHILETS